MSPTSPFARKVRVAARLLALDHRVTEITTSPITSTELRGLNPLSKIPTLVLDDGTTLYDSPVICAYLDALGNHRIVPAAGPQRWLSLRREALGDGIAEATMRVFQERASDTPNQKAIDRQLLAIVAGLDQASAELATFANPPTLGEVSIAVALGYLDLRLADLGWRSGRPALAEWYAGIDQLPAMAATRPPT